MEGPCDCKKCWFPSVVYHWPWGRETAWVLLSQRSCSLDFLTAATTSRHLACDRKTDAIFTKGKNLITHKPHSVLKKRAKFFFSSKQCNLLIVKFIFERQICTTQLWIFKCMTSVQFLKHRHPLTNKEL